MRVAVLSDVHGNIHALEAVLHDIQHAKVDQIVCAGDIPNPFLRSRDAWVRIKGLGIPVLRGNHEDYIVSYFSGDRPEIRDAVQFRPIQIVARHLGPEIAGEFASLPFDLTLSGPRGDDLYICHASPLHNARSYIKGVDDEMARSFEARAGRARTVVAGHIHHQWVGQWQGTRLVICGSVGIPHHGKPEAQYVILTHSSGEWHPDLRTVPYDVEAALQEYRQSQVFAEGGPVARLLYEELRQARPQLIQVLAAIRALPPHQRPRTLEEWERWYPPTF